MEKDQNYLEDALFLLEEDVKLLQKIIEYMEVIIDDLIMGVK